VFSVWYDLGFYIPEEGILNSHRRENLKYYITLTCWALQQKRDVFPVRCELFFISQKTTIFIINKINSVAFSPQANYTDGATATYRRILVPTFVDRGVSRGLHGGSPTVVNLSFLDRLHNQHWSIIPPATTNIKIDKS
jgi:hypothetical protein